MYSVYLSLLRLYAYSIEAIHVGSVRIDELFEDRAKEYLGTLKMDGDLEYLARGMRHGAFQQLKISFGTGLDVDINKLSVRENSTELMNLSK